MVDVMRKAEQSTFPYGNWKEDASIDSGSAAGYPADMHAMYGTSPSNGVRRPDSPEEHVQMYLLEHLATFTVSPEMGTLGPRDGMRRLLQMEKTTGIWTQKMELRLRNQSVIIVDHENGDLVERFPMQLIREPTAFTSNDPKELYNNIFIFIITEDPTRHSMNPPEMHIFQCLRVSAQQLVEEMKAYMSGKLVRPPRLPPPPSSPPPEPPNGTPRTEQMALFNTQSRHFESSRHSWRERERERERAGSDATTDDVSSTSSEKYERDVAVLNHCFDDIEKFIARLQQAAVASRELERRRKTRKAKKKDFGEGMLSMRAKPPPRRDFVEILQKFKLSFNLLAKLKAHIHDPNAPELVHFLFTPLALIVDASRDSSHGANLPSEVVAPLLTRDAIDLLVNCLTSKESELWHSLGEAWCRPRDQWEGHLPVYSPVFLDGWAPDLHDDKERAGSAMRAAASDAHRLRTEKIPRAEQETERRDHTLRDERYHSDPYYDSDQPSLPSPSSRGGYRRQQRHSREQRERTRTPSSERGAQGARSEASAESVGASSFLRQQRIWFDDLKLRGARIVQVTYPRTANNDKELTVTRGEYLEVIDDSRKWWRARNSLGQTAHVPHTIVTPVGPDDSDPATSADWVKKEKQGKKALPHEPYSPYTSEDDTPKEPPRKAPPPVLSPPPPPPPPPPPVRRATPPPQPKSKSQLKRKPRKVHNNSDFDEELRSVLGTWRKARNQLDILKTPDASLFQHSTPADVQDWLKVKGFSDRVYSAFKNLKGEKLFKFEKNKLIKLFGQEEGTRLYSQITVQKKMNGFSTMNTAELKKVLAKARMKADSEAVDLPDDFDFGLSADDEDSPAGSLQRPRPHRELKSPPPPLPEATLPVHKSDQLADIPATSSKSPRQQLDSVFSHDASDPNSDPGTDPDTDLDTEPGSDASGATTGTLRAMMDMQRHQLAMRANKTFLPAI